MIFEENIVQNNSLFKLAIWNAITALIWAKLFMFCGKIVKVCTRIIIRCSNFLKWCLLPLYIAHVFIMLDFVELISIYILSFKTVMAFHSSALWMIIVNCYFARMYSILSKYKRMMLAAKIFRINVYKTLKIHEINRKFVCFTYKIKLYFTRENQLLYCF